MSELRPLLQIRPFLSVMHAKAYSSKCEIIWSGKNQEGAGTTAGEEVEMVNSYLSHCALTTKYMKTSESSNILTKKKIFDVYMSKVQLQEEKMILMREMTLQQPQKAGLEPKQNYVRNVFW
ncbi:hypothetical protein PFLUV_G00049310 [Perca fluviatilis]|uniref:Uncharacterized protein n=1 Tax=Perca fluviatilis TaxID=8168 RepID=A0A6A5FAB6_PERFL|nr:hypothetical protein PFLUV_G00049310 [Perca fluviatilis]